jgi:hypothetical protein
VVAAAAAAATAAAASRGLVLFVFLEFFDSIFGLVGPSFGVVCPHEVGAEALVEEAEGGGEVFGIVQEDLAVAWSGGLEHHCCGARGEGVGERGLDEFGDVVAVGVLVNDPGLLVNCSFPHGNVTSVRHPDSLLVVVDGDVGFGGGEHDLFCCHGALALAVAVSRVARRASSAATVARAMEAMSSMRMSRLAIAISGWWRRLWKKQVCLREIRRGGDAILWFECSSFYLSWLLSVGASCDIA